MDNVIQNLTTIFSRINNTRSLKMKYHMKSIIIFVIALSCILILTSCGTGIAQKGNTGPESSYSEKSSSQELISEQEAMDIAYRTAKQEFGDVELTDEDGNPVEGLNISYDVQQPVIYERDEKKHTVTVSILVMMKINGEGNSGTFQYYVVDMKTGNCSREDMDE